MLEEYWASTVIFIGIFSRRNTAPSLYTERKNLIESKRSWPMRYLFSANEIIYLIQ